MGNSRRWTVGRRVPINVYDENGAPVCQCQTVEYARIIVQAVNRKYGYDDLAALAVAETDL